MVYTNIFLNSRSAFRSIFTAFILYANTERSIKNRPAYLISLYKRADFEWNILYFQDHSLLSLQFQVNLDMQD
jgi:hypothetical protein